jgi:prepilin-type N-terminal cleavage/methylation domain-containing protein
MERLAQKPQGFTLIELLVYIAVSTVALMVFVTFMVDVSRSAARARTVQELHQNAQFVMDRLSREVRLASAIDPSSNASKLVLSTVGGPTFTLVGNAVTLNGESLTSSNVKVTTLQFSYAIPTVTVQLQVVENTSAASPQSIDLQTTLVPRQAVYQ